MKFKVGDKVKEIPKIHGDKVLTIRRIDKDEDCFFEETTGFAHSYGLYKYYEKLTLDDLEFGDIVTFKTGIKTINTRYYFISDNGVIFNKNCYNNDLTSSDTFNNTIIKVERVGNIIWERNESKVKEMTMKEISEALGYEVKIIKEE